MSKIYGYCRISRKSQSIDRQIRNILKLFPEADIKQEAYTGTKVDGRKEFQSLLSRVKSGDTIVFDSVSRMSRNAEDGIKLYMDLYDRGIKLVFLKERHIDTESYDKALKSAGIVIDSDGTSAGDLVSDIAKSVTKFMRAKASDDIVKAFEQAEKEVKDLQQRTKEGIETARLNGKQIGLEPGTKLITKKSLAAKEKIKKYNKDFDGMLCNEDTWKLIGISKMSFYKYKKELIAELNT